MGSAGKPHETERQDLAAMLARLKHAWQEVGDPAQGVDLRQFLPPPGATLRTAYLVHLVIADLGFGVLRGRGALLDPYLDRFPELRTHSQLPRLIYEEYRLRHRHGDRPPLADYRERFPGAYAELEKLVSGNAPGTVAAPTNAPGPRRSAILSAIAPDPPPAPVGPAAFGNHYRLLRRLGVGTYGEVWLAEAPGGVQVAVKRIFRPTSQADGQRELEVLELIKNLRHPYLLATQAFWQEEDRLYIVMELADGSLRDRFNFHLKQGRDGIPVEELLPYFEQVAAALDYLREQRVQHRDVKPENLLMLGGYAKVADFGLARQSSGHDLSIAGLCGSPQYIAPEVWNDKVSPHSDQYSLAVTYAHMRLGKHPFRSDSIRSAMRAHLEAPPDLEPLPAAEKAVLRKALAKDPFQRYTSCCAFVSELARAIEAAPPPPNRRRSLVGVVCFLAALAGLGAGAWALWPREHVPDEPLSHKPWLPDGFQSDGPEKGNLPETEHLFQRISTTRSDVRFEFRLIPGYADRRNFIDVPPFYMLRDKVTVEQFRLAAADERFQKRLRELEIGHPPMVNARPRSGNWKDAKLTKDPRWPVQDVTVTEAHCFAEWLGCLLPSAEEWDRAGGFYDGDKGPFEPSWAPPPKLPPDNGDVAVGQRREPLRVGQARKDRSRYGCRDMAGNGLEWTRTLVDAGGGHRAVPLLPPQGSDRVVVRGQSYTANGPLLFGQCPAPLAYWETRAGVSCRMVLEIPLP